MNQTRDVQEKIWFAKIQEGRVDYKEGNYNKAHTLFHNALEFYIDAGDQKRIAQCNIQLGRLKYKSYKYNESISHHEEAIKAASDIRNMVEEAYSYLGLGVAFLFQYNFLIAEEKLKKSEEIFCLMKNEKGMFKAYYYLMLLYFFLKEPSLSEGYYKKLLEIRKSSDFLSEQTATNHLFSLISSSKADFREAINFMTGCISSSEEKKEIRYNKLRGKAYCNLTLIHFLVGEYDRAKEVIKNCIELFDKDGDRMNLAKALIVKSLLSSITLDKRSIKKNLINAKQVCDSLPIEKSFEQFLMEFLFIFPDASKFLGLLDSLIAVVSREQDSESAHLVSGIQEDLLNSKLKLSKVIADIYRWKATKLVTKRTGYFYQSKAEKIEKEIDSEIEKYKEANNSIMIEYLYEIKNNIADLRHNAGPVNFIESLKKKNLHIKTEPEIYFTPVDDLNRVFKEAYGEVHLKSGGIADYDEKAFVTSDNIALFIDTIKEKKILPEDTSYPNLSESEALADRAITTLCNATDTISYLLKAFNQDETNKRK